MTQIQLRGGFTVTDPRLGRLPEFDPKSREYPVRALIPPRKQDVLKGRSWIIPHRYDQGVPLPRTVVEQIMRELGLIYRPWDPSACTGNSAGYDLISTPRPYKAREIDQAFAFKIYRLAQTMDEWAGEAYEGSSVLGTCKAMVKLGYVGEYRWAFGIDDVLLALSHVGPVVVGTDWQESMFDPKPNGELIVTGGQNETAGGHAYIFQSIILNKLYRRFLLGRGEPDRGEPLLRLHQSWGDNWGRKGDALVWASDLELLLKGISYPGEARITTSHFHKLPA